MFYRTPVIRIEPDWNVKAKLKDAVKQALID